MAKKYTNISTPYLLVQDTEVKPSVNYGYGTYNSVDAAKAAIITDLGSESVIPFGLTIGINTNDVLAEYYWNGTTFVEKAASGSGLTDDERTALNELMEQKNPLTISATGGSTNALSSRVTPSGTITVKKGNVDVTDQCTITINNDATISGNAWSYGSTIWGKTWDATTKKCSEDKTFTITATYNGKSVSTSVSVKFLPYVYMGVWEGGTPTSNAIQALPKHLGTETTLGATNLAAGKGYIFACIANGKKLVCRDNGTNGWICESNTGMSLYINGTSYSYIYIVVPASEINWTLKITEE